MNHPDLRGYGTQRQRASVTHSLSGKAGVVSMIVITDDPSERRPIEEAVERSWLLDWLSDISD